MLFEEQFRPNILHYFMMGSPRFKVKFKKVSGELREMTCTVKRELINHEFKKPKTGDELKEIEQQQLDYVRVYNLDINEWRTLKFDQIEELELKYEDKIVKILISKNEG